MIREKLILWRQSGPSKLLAIAPSFCICSFFVALASWKVYKYLLAGTQTNIHWLEVEIKNGGQFSILAGYLWLFSSFFFFFKKNMKTEGRSEFEILSKHFRMPNSCFAYFCQGSLLWNMIWCLILRSLLINSVVTMWASVLSFQSVCSLKCQKTFC